MKILVALMLAVVAASALGGCRAEVETDDRASIAAPR